MKIRGRLNSSNLFFLVIFVLLTSVATTFAQGKKGSEEMVGVSDADLIKNLASKKDTLADEVVSEILRRGEKLVPALLELKGDKRFFYGTLAKDSSFAMRSFSPNKNPDLNQKMLKEGKLVTVEVAGIYLISAIFYESLDIAQSPYLTNLSLAPRDRRAANTEDVVEKAWQSTESWSLKLKTVGMAKLRDAKEDPLADAGVKFW